MEEEVPLGGKTEEDEEERAKKQGMQYFDLLENLEVSG